MNRRVLLLSWPMVAAGLATADETDFTELVRGVAAPPGGPRCPAGHAGARPSP